MTHRTDMECVDVEDFLQDVIKTWMEHGYSRIPVYEEDPDNVVGIIYIKDLLKMSGPICLKQKRLRT